MNLWGALALMIVAVIAVWGLIVLLSNPTVQLVLLLLGIGGFLVLVKRASGGK